MFRLLHRLSTESSTEPSEYNEEDECRICLEPFSLDSVWLSCTHRFHDACISAWQNSFQNASEFTCPICRSGTTVEEEA